MRMPVDRPKVLVVSSIYPSHDKPYRGTWVHKHARQLAESGCEVRIFTTRSLTFATYLRPRAVLDYYRLPRSSTYDWNGMPVKMIRFHLAMPTQYSRVAPHLTYRAIKPELLRLREEFPFDIIQAWTGEYLGLAASRLAKELGVPFISSAIGSHVNLACRDRNSLRFGVERELFLNSNLVVCVSDDMNRKVKQMTDGRAETLTFRPGLDPAVFAPNAELRAQYRRKLSFSEKERVLITVCNLVRAKGIFELIEAFAGLAREAPSLRLLLVGDPVEKRRIDQAIRRLGIAPQVTLAGGVGQEEIPGYLNAADLFVFPSWMEGLPNAVMEAGACELPVVASRVGGIPELIEDGRSGILVEPRDSRALAKRIAELLQSPERAAILAKSARQNIIENYCYQKNGKRIVAVIRSILDAQNRPAPNRADRQDTGAGD